MKALIQRVAQASVAVAGVQVGAIGAGLLVFLGVEQQDDSVQVARLVDRVLNYRVFVDAQDRMNLSLLDVRGQLLVVSQFTLAAQTDKGLRPGFSRAAAPDLARRLYDEFVAVAGQRYQDAGFKNAAAYLATGQFGADMQVSLTNDGPVTLLLAS